MVSNLKYKQFEELKAKQQKGHRSRLCNKLSQGNHENLPDYEVVELMLFLIFKRKDTKPLAKLLLDKYKTIDKIIAASKDDLLLIDGIGEATFKSLKIIEAVLNSVLKSKLQKRKVIDCFEDVINYCKYNMKHLTSEQLRIIFLNNLNEIIGDEILQRGSLNEVNANPKEIVRKCIELGASGFILIHNHPSGDPTPSVQDVYITKKINEAADIFNIKLHDHIIIGGDRYISFKNLLILK